MSYNIVQCHAIFCNVVQDHAILHGSLCNCLQSCATLCNSVQHWAVLRNMVQYRAKIDPKTVLGEALRHPKSSPNRSGDALGTPRGIQERSKSVPRAFRDVRGTSRKRPESAQRRPRTSKNASGRVWELVEASKIDAKSSPEPKKSGFSCTARSRSGVGTITYQFRSIVGFAAKSANP